jgi:hypothetical protein
MNSLVMQFIFQFTLTLYNCKSKIIYMIVILFSGHMDNRCLATAAFVKGFDDVFNSFSGVTRSLDHGKLLHCLSSTSKHMEYWRSAADKVKTWTSLNKESEPMHPPPSQTGWLITIGAVQHVWMMHWF